MAHFLNKNYKFELSKQKLVGVQITHFETKNQSQSAFFITVNIHF